MRFLKTMLPLLTLLIWSVAARADYNPANPPEPGVNFTLTTRCEPAGAGYNLTSTGTHAFGSSVYLNVRPNTGYRFVGWEDEEGTQLSTSQSFTYIMPSRDVTVTAHFVYDPDNPEEPSTPVFKDVSEISFEINPSNAGYFSNNYKGEYEVGTTHNFTVNSYSEYRFINWTRDGEVVGTSRTLTYTVPKGDHTLTANFEYNPENPDEPGTPHIHRTLTLVSQPKGAVSSFRGEGKHPEGSNVDVGFYKNDYYFFQNWTDEEGNVVSDQASFRYTMPDRNVTLTANFLHDYNPSSPGEPGTPNPGGAVGENMVAWPRFGMYDDTHVQILCETPGSTIHYTLDGSDPTAASPVYSEPVFVGSNLLVKAIAYVEGMEDSPIVSYRVTAYHAMTPVYIFENRKIKITSGTEGAIIRYTLDFSEPNAESTVFTEPFEPEENCRIKAYASKEGLTDSPVSVYVYRRSDHTIPAPEFSLNEDCNVVITPAVTGGETRYTIDGSEPNSDSPLYVSPLDVPDDCVVKAYTTHINYFDSPIGEYDLSAYLEARPVLEKDFRNCTITITQSDQRSVSINIDGVSTELETPATIAVSSDMSSITVVAMKQKEDRHDSRPVTESIVFHKPPVLVYDGHAVRCSLADGEPAGDGAEVWAYFNDNLRQKGHGEQYMEVYEFGNATVHLESDVAFKSDNSELTIDYFNTGRKAGARNGHRLQEAFGTWGDKPEDYTYLRVIGEVEKEELQFIGTLPNLTTLHLDPYTMPEEDCDNVFSGSRIETIFSNTYPQGMLKGMPRLTTVMWGLSHSKMPDGRLEEAGNPNILLWTTDANNAPSDTENIVVYDYIGEEYPTDPEGPGIEGHAKSLRLFAGYPFSVHMPIDVEQVMVVKEFTQSTEIGECRGWETIVLPFDAQQIRHDYRGEIVPFKAYDEENPDVRPFWLYEATSDDWQEADMIKAGVPYIISMPNNPEYIPDYNLNGLVGFIAYNVTLGREESAAQTTEWKDGMHFSGTFMPTEESDILSLNTGGEGGQLPGSVFIAEARTLPFGAYVSQAGSRQMVPVFGESGVIGLPTVTEGGIAIDSSVPGTIRISSVRDCGVTVCSVEGAVVAKLRVGAGEIETVDGLSKGVYIVAGQKIMVK